MSTWWIDEPFLLGSSNPTEADLGRLRGDGFRIIVSLLNEGEQPPNCDPERARELGYVRYNIPIRDLHAPTVAQLKEFVTLTAGVGVDARIIVHCEAGIGRTGTMAAAYWISKGLSSAAAVAKVRKARSGAVEIAGQRAVLDELEAGLA